MQVYRDKITLGLTGLAYLACHLRLGETPGSILAGTLYQILFTAPYALGFTYVLAILLRRLTGGSWPPWDRLLRIFFTLGILFGFFFALYEYAGGDIEADGREDATVSMLAPHAIRSGPWYWA